LLDILKKNIDITNLSNFKTKAKTRYYFEINNISDVSKLDKIFNYIDSNNLKYLFI